MFLYLSANWLWTSVIYGNIMQKDISTVISTTAEYIN